jgi:hypothetical protein
MFVGYCCREREVFCCRRVSIVRSSTGCEDEPYSWVRREGKEEEIKERERCKLSTQIELYVSI